MFKPKRSRVKIQQFVFDLENHVLGLREKALAVQGGTGVASVRKKKTQSVQLHLGSDQDRVSVCSSQEAALEVILYHLTSSPQQKKGASEEKGFLPEEQAWHWSSCTSTLHVKSLSKKHLSCQYCCCYCFFSSLMAVSSKLLSS